MNFKVALGIPEISPGHEAVALDKAAVHDVLILGAGLTAAGYCMRKRARTVLIATGFGGQVA